MITFRDWLYEASQRDIDDSTPEKLPFDNIFDDKTRIVIPLGREIEYQFIRDMQKAGYNVDITSNTASKIINTNKGPQERKERIGKVLGKLVKKDPDGDWQDWAHWWEREKPKISQLQKSPSGVSIVISRHPVDVLRMADHDEFESCHSPDGGWYHCAKAEAKSGGAIAYVVRNKDLEKVNIQDEEIFLDPDRGIDGIEPLERLRFRRLSKKLDAQSNGPQDIIIPEKRTYGIGHSGFKETIANWATIAQKLDQIPDYQDYDLRGGSYQDTPISELWNDFFKLQGTNKVTGVKQTVDEEDDSEVFFDEAENTLIHHQRRWSAYFANLSFHNEETPMVCLEAFVNFSYPESEFIKIPTIDDFKGTGKGKGPLGELLPDATGEWAWDDEVRLLVSNGMVTINAIFKDEELGMCHLNLHDLERSLDNIDELDAEYQRHKSNIYIYLMKYGFIKDFRKDPNLNFKNFLVISDEEDTTLISKPLWLGNAQGLDRDLIAVDTKNLHLNPIGLPKNSATSVDFPKTPNVKKQFANTLKLNESNIHWFAFSNINSHRISYTKKTPPFYDKPLSIGAFIRIDLQQWSHFNKFIPIVKQIDDNFQSFQDRSAEFWNKLTPYLQTKNLMGTPQIALKPFKPIKTQYVQKELPFENFKEFIQKFTLYKPFVLT